MLSFVGKEIMSPKGPRVRAIFCRIQRKTRKTRGQKNKKTRVMDKKINTSIEEIDAQYDEIMKEREERAARRAESEKKFEFDIKRYFDSKIEGKGPAERTTKVRFLPFYPTEGKLFQRIKMHTIKVPAKVSEYKAKSYVCLENNPQLVDVDKQGGVCPVCQLIRDAREAMKSATTKAEREALGNVIFTNNPGDFFMCRLIERGHEEDGPKFWKFRASSKGDGVYDKVMELYRTRNAENQEATGEAYNIFDLYEGKDITVTIKKNEKDRYSYLFVDSSVKTPLSKDEKLMEKWVFDPFTWNNAYSVKSAPYLAILLENKTPTWDKDNNCWTSEEDLEEKERVAEEAQDDEGVESQTFKAKVDYDNFGETESMGQTVDVDNEEYDDLPF